MKRGPEIQKMKPVSNEKLRSNFPNWERTNRYARLDIDYTTLEIRILSQILFGKPK